MRNLFGESWDLIVTLQHKYPAATLVPNRSQSVWRCREVCRRGMVDERISRDDVVGGPEKI